MGIVWKNTSYTQHFSVGYIILYYIILYYIILYSLVMQLCIMHYVSHCYDFLLFEFKLIYIYSVFKLFPFQTIYLPTLSLIHELCIKRTSVLRRSWNTDQGTSEQSCKIMERTEEEEKEGLEAERPWIFWKTRSLGSVIT